MELISRHEAEMKRKDHIEAEIERVMSKLNEMIPVSYTEDTQFGVQVACDSVVLPKVMEILRRSKDWQCVGYQAGCFQLRATK